MFRRKVDQADALAQPEINPSDRPFSSANDTPYNSDKAAPDATITPNRHGLLPLAHGKKSTRGIKADGESGRSGFHPLHFLWICFRSSSRLSMAVNILWPLVPAAIAVHFVYHGGEHYVLIFTLNYLALIPCANLIGFAGQELARKLPKVFGVLLETTIGSATELILFTVLVVFASQGRFETGYSVIKAAILGSILANLLLCLGLCFIAGGVHHQEQVFHEVMSEVGSGLMLVAGVGLITPTVFTTAFSSRTEQNILGYIDDTGIEAAILSVSRATAIALLIAFAVYVFFQTTSHHGIYDEVLESDEQNDRDRHKDLAKAKLTLTECVIALLIGAAGVALTAVFLVQEIDEIVHNNHVSDTFMGLILVPLVEKAAEHLTAVDEAYDNQANFALAHVLGASIQTALLNAPLVVIIGWGLSSRSDYTPMDFNFHTFEAIMLILAIIVVGNFLRDGKSNYLEGSLCVLVYVIIAVCAFYYPNVVEPSAASEGSTSSTGIGESAPTGAESATPVETAVEAAKMLLRMV